jgi:uncharacterized protein YodC (DUF2158 family)
MRDLFNFLIWITIIGFLIGGIQINKDPEKTSAKFKSGDEVTVVIGSDKIDATVKSYLSIKLRWFENSSINYEVYTVIYKDSIGVLHTETVQSSMIKSRENKNPLNLYEYNN